MTDIKFSNLRSLDNRRMLQLSDLLICFQLDRRQNIVFTKRNEWMNHLDMMNRYINIDSILNRSLGEMYAPLVNSFTDDGAIPYLIGTNSRYRASPLASIIIWMSMENLIPLSVVEKLYEMLIYLRDNSIIDSDEGRNSKNPEDIYGWSLAEGVSVWSTSMAIIALFSTNINISKFATEIKNSIIWLTNQDDDSAIGWGYQLSPNCLPNPIMTSLAIQALALALNERNKSYLKFSSDEKKLIRKTINGGLKYLKESCEKKGKMVFWSFAGDPSCHATTWTLLAFKAASEANETFSDDCAKYFTTIKKPALTFLISKIPQKGKWKDELLVEEDGAKYDKHKHYIAYTPTLLPQLFDLGLPPFHPKVIGQISWLVTNRDKWTIEKYDKGSYCSFTYAMVLSTIVSWIRRVGSECAKSILTPNNCIDKISIWIFGYKTSGFNTIQLVWKKRIPIIFIATIFGGLLLFFSQEINVLVRQLAYKIISIWINTETDRHNILINLVASGIWAIGLFIITKTISLFTKMAEKFLNDK